MTPPRPPLPVVPPPHVQAALETFGLAWRQRSACTPEDAELFYGPEDHKQPPVLVQRRIAAAKAICTRCPVLAPCRAYALAAREPYGIWGGLTRPERDRLNRTRSAGEAA